MKEENSETFGAVGTVFISFIVSVQAVDKATKKMMIGMMIER